ncbi:MAG: ergothioneine biosynthesis glutamate--cysteine ligase EgtA [Acidimicrobiia bacterium]|nr:ergothioneine biosynthesis glutamate--cysteine ligase EgtA [Acidimicrobiia bacterium]
MPSPHQVLGLDEARCLAERSLPTDGPAGRVGVEVEWLPVVLTDPSRRAPHEVVDAAVAAAGPLPGGSRVTFEPGGQLELSSAALHGPTAAVQVVANDAAALCHHLADAGVGLVAVGLDPGPLRPRVLDAPRYSAMEAYFDGLGSHGRTMMRATAAVQVNLDPGPGAGTDRRWQAAHSVGPVLAAAFANSPLADGRPSGWRSTRLAVWAAVDPSRTAPAGCKGLDGRAAWSRYVLEAPVMLVRATPTRFTPVLRPMPFRRWVTEGHELGFPTVDDLEYHLTTLFPPVRPRGWLELRMIDALPHPWWRVATAVATALLDDEEATERAWHATDSLADLWTEAARHGLDHPGLAQAARACFAAALEALPRLGADPVTTAATTDFHDRYVLRGRCPADDRLAEWAERGALVPDLERLEGVGT